MTYPSRNDVDALRPPSSTHSCLAWVAMGAFLLASCGGGGAGGPSALSSDGPRASITSPLRASVLDGRLIAGYQAWFGCPGDEEGNTRWFHWFDDVAQVSRLTVEMLPDVKAVPASALCDSGLRTADGQTLKLYTAMDPALVDQQFSQMAASGVGGVALQRFVTWLPDPLLKRRVDRILANAMASAQRQQLPVYITYDVSGADDGNVLQLIRSDWADVHSRYDLATHPGYLRDQGHPVLQLWGFGFPDRPGEPQGVRQLIEDLKRGHDAPPAFLVGGVPARWSSLGDDSKADAAWAGVYAAYDVLSPWTVGLYANAQEATAYITGLQKDQQALAARNGQGFLPVVFPGFSSSNLMALRKQSTPLNQIPRDCGRLLAAQFQGLAATGARSAYVAMFDEMDEATAMLPTLATQAQVPVGVTAVTLDQDGCQLPADYYLQALKQGASMVKP
jgi:hypothetical protein